ncbi:venom allergen 5 isoform X2 [Tribolium castaneum]|uniref:Venom allergen 5-like Protein n=1 Tax=Tribolium castaneum TaxID=7070 RepID=A0A139WG89_TRICA|nr:PREDICTED: venom allergen 5 isoform X2 [Tribolium castaneum]KYB26916.1 Venom allergen 5-like Protein [Tribolium castaneum]|eukprot:XP_008194974.1 PREDICTED: venom allergen 5 isoform X2 [Tribolium castaneum]
MFRSVLFVLCFFYTSGEKFSPKKARFCKIYCGEVKHSACECSSRDGRKEVGLLEVVQFRKLVVGVHNKYRNLVASGKETRGGVGAAADMMALSYSLELEFMVRCWGRSRFHGYYDSCRTMLNGREAGQNIAGDAWQDFTLELVEEQIRKWYEQVKDMKPDIIDSYRPLKAEGIQINHFTAMVWGQADVIGCARIYTEDTVKASFINPTFHQSLICDYGITILRNDTKIKGVNIKGRPVYTKGKPCSMCPAEYKCNLNWTSLCGESKVPEDPAYVFDSPSSAKCAENARILVLIVVVLHSLF